MAVVSGGTMARKEKLPPEVVKVMIGTTMLTFAVLALAYRLLFWG